MSQESILDLLSRNKRIWFSSKDVSIKLGMTQQNANISLRKLLKRKEVECKHFLAFGKYPRFYYKYRFLKK